MAAITKTNRIDIRITTEDKNKIEMAAFNKNQSVSNYILDIILKQVELDLNPNEEVVLSKNDSKTFLDMLKNPPKPTKEQIEYFNK